MEARDQLGGRVSGLEKQVDGLARSLQAMTPRRAALQSAREARYVWAAGGFLLGLLLLFGVSVLLLAAGPRLPG